MAEINKAYDVLGNREKRARYDATGETSEPSPILEKARSIIAQIFTQLLEQDEKNVVRAAKLKVAEGRKQVVQGRDSMKAKLEEIARREGKTVTKASVNLLEGLLAARKEGLLKGLAAAEEALLLNDEIAKELDLYESEAPTGNVPYHNPYASQQGQGDLLFGWTQR